MSYPTETVVLVEDVKQYLTAAIWIYHRLIQKINNHSRIHVMKYWLMLLRATKF